MRLVRLEHRFLRPPGCPYPGVRRGLCAGGFSEETRASVVAERSSAGRVRAPAPTWVVVIGRMWSGRKSLDPSAKAARGPAPTDAEGGNLRFRLEFLPAGVPEKSLA